MFRTRLMDRSGVSTIVLFGAAILACATGAAIAQIPSVEATAILLGGLCATVLAMRLPGAFLFFACMIGNSAFGFVDLTVETPYGVIALDFLLLYLVATFLTRSAIVGGFLHVRQKTADPRFRFLFAVLCLIAAWYLITLAKFEQSAGMTLKAARSTLFYLFGFWGVFANLSGRDVRGAIRGLALGGVVLSIIVIVGSVVDLAPFLPGIPRVSSYVLPEASYFRTVPWGYEFVYLALFLFMFCETEFSRSYRVAGLVTTALGALALAFRAYWIGIIGALLVLHFTPRVRERLGKSTIGRTLGAVAVIVVVLALTGAVQVVFRRVELVQEDLSTGRGSVAIRLQQIRALLPIVLDDPVLGVGFLHGDGPYSSRIAPLRGLLINRFGTSDVGWMDVLVRFGFLGTVIMAVLYVRLFRSLDTEIDGRLEGLASAIRGMILMGAFALPGAALFSIPNGIMSIVLPCGIFIGAAGAANLRDGSRASRTNAGRTQFSPTERTCERPEQASQDSV